MEKLVGFIGLGIMGKPMAKNLIKAGFKLMVFDIDKGSVEEVVEAGATKGDLAEIGARCDVIFTILPNGKVVQEVLFGEKGVASAMKSGSIVVDMSSVTPVESGFCAEKLKALEADFLDAPVSGGEPKAIDGTLAFMVGGEKEVFDSVMPYFQAMGSSMLLTGGTGSGSVTKLVNQIIVNLNITAVAEGLVFAQKVGADPKLVYEAIRGGLAGSTVLDAKAPLMFNRAFNPGGKISVNHKDIKNVLDTAHAMDVPLPMTAQLFEIMQTLKIMDCFDDDHCAIVKYFERLADVEVKCR